MYSITVTIRIDGKIKYLLEKKAQEETISTGYDITFNKLCAKILTEYIDKK